MDSERLSVTIKASSKSGRDEPWLVFKGTADTIKQDVVEAFGLNAEESVSLTLWEVVQNANSVAHGAISAVRRELGGTITSAEKSAWDEAVPAASSNEPKQDGDAWLLAQIEATGNVDDLKALWAKNQAAFADATVMAAWKAKGKSLAA